MKKLCQNSYACIAYPLITFYGFLGKLTFSLRGKISAALASISQRCSRRYHSRLKGNNPIIAEQDKRNEALSSIITVSTLLREPLATTSALLTSNRRFLAEADSYRNEIQAPRIIKRLVGDIRIPQGDEFEAYLNEDKRSKIFASFHFGHFVYGLHKAMLLAQRGLGCKVLSESAYSQNLLTNLQAGFSSHAANSETQMLLNKTDSRSLSAFLRSPYSGLLMFADLPAQYGETVTVDFLSRAARFPKGIAMIALANRVPILPMICLHQHGRPLIEMGKVIEPQRRPDEDREGALIRITQQLIHFFEYHFQQQPSHWRYLTQLPHYFDTQKGQ